MATGSTTHTYVVTTATAVQGIATIIGTVDSIPSTGAIPVTVTINLADLVYANSTGGIAAVKNLVAPVMLQVAITNGLPLPVAAAVVQLPTGTFTQ